MSKESNNAIEVKNLSKHFKLPTEHSDNLKQIIVNWTKGIKGYKKQQVLKDISFNVEKGDFFGIVGRNGSGKSTLLKLISGIYAPDSGSIKINGSLVSFIELGVGFNPELTGRENVYLNGALLGFTVKEIDEMYDEIVDFAELRDFMDQKLKNYSSGMQVRLAFSCAIRAKSDILVLDEVLAVGDEAFQRKCDDFFTEIKKDKSKTIVLVTHSMASVRKYCTKAMMLRDGKVTTIGSPEDVANEYSLENVEDGQKSTKSKKAIKNDSIKNIKVEMMSPRQVSQNEDMVVQIQYKVGEEMAVRSNVNIVDVNRQVPLYASRSELVSVKAGDIVKQEFRIKLDSINDTACRLVFTVRNDNDDILAFVPEETLPAFILRRTDYPVSEEKTTYAVAFNRGTWKSKK